MLRVHQSHLRSIAFTTWQFLERFPLLRPCSRAAESSAILRSLDCVSEFKFHSNFTSMQVTFYTVICHSINSFLGMPPVKTFSKSMKSRRSRSLNSGHYSTMIRRVYRGIQSGNKLRSVNQMFLIAFQNYSS